MNEKNERNLDSTVDEIMEEIREQTVSEVKDINEKEQKSEERPRKKKVTKTKRPSGHHVSGDGVDHKAASGEDRPVKRKAPRRKKKVVREETGLLDLDGAVEEQLPLLSACTKIYSPICEGVVAKAKVTHYEKLLKEMDCEEILKETSYLQLPFAEPASQGEYALEQLVNGEMGNYVRTLLRSEE